ncbi:DUF342 domain-containing protein [Motilimonas eburnea]|uniref:DUF342 domain-containing protein n=1 Tax=Motilimonas eburnea TaxID=1737488 RepID=UPI001E2E1CBD|nr:FapA family protein [Motilimonas eburnea]MCE2570385.1 FapA family protein [Motilimonas eburnea]
MISPDLLTLHENDVDLLLDIPELLEPVTETHVLDALSASPYADFKPSSVGMTDALTRLNAKEPSENTDPVIIAQRLDAVVAIEIDKEKMTAIARVTAPWGGKKLDEDVLKEAISAAGVTYGIRENNIHALVSTLNKSRPGQLIKAPVAKGKPAIDGKDTRFERLVETLKERVKKPRELQGGKVDMRDLGALVSVSKGKPLMRKHPKVEGEDGFKVTGEVITHKEGKEIAFNVGKNTEVSNKNANYLVATNTGIPIEIEHGMIVDDVLMINNVDVSFGHVDFDGSILIKGDICEGMKVKASGDISVSGLIESAHVEAGGDLHVEKGVIGHHTDDGFSCELIAHGEIIGVFAQYTKIECHGALHFNHQLSHCDVTCFDKVEVIDSSGRRGTILGGIIRALKGVSTVNLGAEAYTRTEIQLIGELEAKRKEKKFLQQEIDDEEHKLEELAQACSKVNSLPASEKKDTLSHRLKLNIEHEQARIEDVKQRIEQIDRFINEYLQSAQVSCAGHLYGGVVVSLDRYTLTTEREYINSHVCLEDEQLIVEPNT